jgi:hypothetical protein
VIIDIFFYLKSHQTHLDKDGQKEALGGADILVAAPGGGRVGPDSLGVTDTRFVRQPFDDFRHIFSDNLRCIGVGHFVDILVFVTFPVFENFEIVFYSSVQIRVRTWRTLSKNMSNFDQNMSSFDLITF